MSHYFPDYRGDDNDYDAACGFLLDKFVSLNQNLDKSIYAVSRVHFAVLRGTVLNIRGLAFPTLSTTRVRQIRKRSRSY